VLYIFAGPDDYSLNEVLKELKKGLGDPALLESNTSVLDGRTASLDELRLVSQSVPFLAEKQAGYRRWSAGAVRPFKGRRPDKKTSSNKAAPDRQTEVKKILDIVDGLPPTTLLVLLEKDIKPGVLYKELASRRPSKPSRY